MTRVALPVAKPQREDRHCVVTVQTAQEHAPSHLAQIFVENIPIRFVVMETKALHDILLKQCEFYGDFTAKLVAETWRNSSTDKIAIRED